MKSIGASRWILSISACHSGAKLCRHAWPERSSMTSEIFEFFSSEETKRSSLTMTGDPLSGLTRHPLLGARLRNLVGMTPEVAEFRTLAPHYKKARTRTCGSPALACAGVLLAPAHGR